MDINVNPTVLYISTGVGPIVLQISATSLNISVSIGFIWNIEISIGFSCSISILIMFELKYCKNVLLSWSIAKSIVILHAVTNKLNCTIPY